MRSRKKQLRQISTPTELQEDLLIALDLYEPKPSQHPSQEIFKTRCMSSCLNKSKHSNIKNGYLATAADRELELPDKLAIGFACALAGALLCVVPGAQGAGLWMIGTGVTIALDGFGEGERPYYRGMNTGEIIPFGNN